MLRARFMRKAKIALGLEHPNIVRTLDMFTEEDGRLGIVMEFVDGASLQQLLKQVRVSPPDALRLTNGLLSALSYLDERDVVRLDLKPSSIMVDSDLQPVIVDLGLAKHEASQRTITADADQLVGTPAYLAPEIIRSQDADIRSDLYTVGMLLFEMLAGRPARRQGELYDVLRRAVSEEVDVDALQAVSPALRAALRRMVAREPDARFATPADAREALAATPEALARAGAQPVP